MLCFEPDDFINDKYESETRWIITLSDGRKVYQDDERPGLSEPSTWKRLKTFLQENPELSVIGMTVGFRDNIINVGDNADGYYFCKAALGDLFSGANMGFYVCGTLKDGELHVKRRKIPELIVVEEEQRDPLTAGDCLICRKTKLNISQLQPQ